MLKILVPAKEWYDEEKKEFFYIEKTTLRLEHSLISISEWESRWEKPFLETRPDQPQRTREEMLDYIRCMCLDSNVSPYTFYNLTPENIQDINTYINRKMTATWFSEYGKKSGDFQVKVVTSEVIYAWMIQYGVPAEYQKWHLNRLLTLIRVLNNFNASSGANKLSKNDLLRRNAALNAARRKAMHTKG